MTRKRGRVFLFPMFEATSLRRLHPYVFGLAGALGRGFDVVNLGLEQSRGWKHAWRYFFACDYFWFNWIEGINRRNSPQFLLLIVALRLARKRVAWVHHNRHPHNSDPDLGRMWVRFLSGFADHVLLHTRESYRLLRISRGDPRFICFFHPFFETGSDSPRRSQEKKYDLLIWGNVRKSKGVFEFLEYLEHRGRLGGFRIKVVGEFRRAADYEEMIARFEGAGVSIENRFVDEPELTALHHEARYVFFPYTGSSVLNSGALIRSLPKGTPIIGPETGAFREAGERGWIHCYRTFDDVVALLDRAETLAYPAEAIAAAMRTYTWEGLGDVLAKELMEDAGPVV